MSRHSQRFYGSIQLLEGENGDVDTGEDIPELSSNRYTNVFNAHGALMVTAWIFLVPLGIIMARYFRQKTDRWFDIHRIVQGTAIIISLASFILALVESVGGISTGHLVIGVIVTALSLLSASAATFFRPVKDSRRRKQFNIMHRGTAVVIFALAVANCYIGRNVLNEFTDTRAFLIVISVGLGVMVVAEIVTLVLIPRFEPAVGRAADPDPSPSSPTKEAEE
uniref:Cytochrome b561 domain-containing protein n=1 Tax=Rhodosorus marinus TaxID=101924 RepID=A0A7S0G3Q2_9RHOD